MHTVNTNTTLVRSNPNTVAKSKFEFNLEALRGVAAFTVVVAHCFGFSKELNGLEQRHGIWNYEFPGHLAVLVFFILSGYVIGLTSKLMNGEGLGTYLKKRFLRLYPIYLLSICAALLITRQHYSATDILSNLFFLQRVTADPMYEVGVNWSLNYEVLFYLLFIPVAVYRLAPALVFMVSFVWALCFQWLLPNELLTMYGYGFCFWVTGLWLSRTSTTVPVATSRFSLGGLLFLFLAFGPLNFVLEVARYKLHLDHLLGGMLITKPTAILISDLSCLPFGIILITFFTGKRIKYNTLLLAYSLVVPLLFMLLQFKASRSHSVDWNPYLLPCCFYLLACGCLLVGWMRQPTTTKLLPSWLVTTGSISYSVYLTHFLIIVLIGRVAYAYGSPSTFWLRLVAVMVLTPVVSYVLEKEWQPWVVRQLKKTPVFS
jgi:peptidoglycan/LPS O-acetylase OafA/YrhL